MDEIPPAATAGTIAAALALMQHFAALVTAETAALRQGERGRFEALTARKREYHAALQQSLPALQPLRAGMTAAERQRWQETALACEAALQENAKLIESKQNHAAQLMDELRAVARERQASTLVYGRDAKPRRER